MQLEYFLERLHTNFTFSWKCLWSLEYIWTFKCSEIIFLNIYTKVFHGLFPWTFGISIVVKLLFETFTHRLHISLNIFKCKLDYVSKRLHTMITFYFASIAIPNWQKFVTMITFTLHRFQPQICKKVVTMMTFYFCIDFNPTLQ